MSLVTFHQTLLTFKSQENNPKSSFARDYIEKNIIKVDYKFWKRKLLDFLNNQTVSLALLEQLYATPKNQEALENLTVSEILEIVVYLRKRIKEIEAKIQQYSFLSRINVVLSSINLLALLMATNPRFASISYAMGIILVLVLFYSWIKTFTFHYYELQYRLIQCYFDNKEEVSKYFSPN